jgi:hypothetical protein
MDPDILKILLGGFVGGLIAHLLALMREGKERKRKFRAVVELIRFEIEAAQKDRIWDVHHNSIGRLQEHAAHVLSDILCIRRDAFRENLIKYSKLTSESLPNFVNADSKTLSPQYEAAIALIIDPLANLIELADGQRGNSWLASQANKAAGAASRK